MKKSEDHRWTTDEITHILTERAA
ncbi:uncharacterized protein METZ01_LOCUS251727 [marine metagenome]|uniref:Uncharacterized protein n=1 Tax=marine metagenome TaxID=408172 RepID=A0A382IJ32_9ZZZZ